MDLLSRLNQRSLHPSNRQPKPRSLRRKSGNQSQRSLKEINLLSRLTQRPLQPSNRQPKARPLKGKSRSQNRKVSSTEKPISKAKLRQQEKLEKAAFFAKLREQKKLDKASGPWSKKEYRVHDKARRLRKPLESIRVLLPSKTDSAICAREERLKDPHASPEEFRKHVEADTREIAYRFTHLTCERLALYAKD